MQYFGKTSAESDELEDIGREILSNCNGLQLAVKSVGRLLSLKTRIEQWQRVLNSEMWPLEEIEKGGFPTLLLSYSDLPVNLKKYCAIFPKDYEIEKDRLIKLWMAQGHLIKWKERDDMESDGEECFKNLAMLSFFQDFEKEGGRSIRSCKNA